MYTFISVSKTLPTIQPKQECPGFKCTSGISKCIPNKRICDKIIDCLNGEDELNCDPTRSTFTDNLFMTPISKDSQFIEELNLQTKEAEADLANNEFTSKVDNASNTESITSYLIPTTSTEPTVKTYKSNTLNIKGYEKDVIIKNRSNDIDIETGSTNKISKAVEQIDFTKASTREIPNLRSNEVKSSSEEHTTDDPESKDISREADESRRGDVTFIMSTSRESLEPMSIVKTTQGKEVDINEDWTDADGLMKSTVAIATSNTESPVTIVTKFSEINLETATNKIIIENKELPTTSTEKIISTESVTENKLPETSTENIVLTDSVTENKFIQEKITENNDSKENMIKNKDVSEITTRTKLPDEFESKTENEVKVHLSALVSNNNNFETTTISGLQSKDLLINLPDTDNAPTLHTNLKNWTEFTTYSPFAKNLLDLEEKTELTDKIKKIIQSQLQPAKVRNKHRFQDSFECRR